MWHAPCCLGSITNLLVISTARQPSGVGGHGAKTGKGKKDHQHKTAKQEMKQDQEAGKPGKERNRRREGREGAKIGTRKQTQFYTRVKGS